MRESWHHKDKREKEKEDKEIRRKRNKKEKKKAVLFGEQLFSMHYALLERKRSLAISKTTKGTKERASA